MLRSPLLPLTSVSELNSSSYVLGSKLVTASLPLHLIAALSYALTNINRIFVRKNASYSGNFFATNMELRDVINNDLAASISLSNNPR